MAPRGGRAAALALLALAVLAPAPSQAHSIELFFGSL